MSQEPTHSPDDLTLARKVLRTEAAAILGLVDRLGGLVPKDVHVDVLERAIAAARDRSRRRRDAIRVVVVGPFCEQPPLDLVQLLEDVGCYVVGDEFHPLQLLERGHAGGDRKRRHADPQFHLPEL